MNSIVFDNVNQKKLKVFAEKIAYIVVPGDVLLLEGPLGAGKTYFAAEFCKFLDVKTIVNSPSYVLLNEYEGKYKIFHYDLYRLSSPEEAFELGILDNISNSISIIEWPQLIEPYIKKDKIHIKLNFMSDYQKNQDKRNVELFSTRLLNL